MNAQRFPNVSTYLHEFRRALNSQASRKGGRVFSVQVLAEGITDGDAALLR